jgi:leader peptidase (prepilin peptidase) / N-methyltransferase
MDIIAGIFVALFGLAAGSFFNVLIYRLPRGESIIRPGSHCPACNRPVRAWENIPVASYILLGGRCAGCGNKISLAYPGIEILTAILALLLWFFFSHSVSSDYRHDLHLALQWFVLLLMIPVAVIDIRHYIIPDILTFSLLGAGLAASFLPGDTTPIQAILGAFAGGATLWGIGWLGRIAFRKGEAMGGGDIKLLAAFGAIWGVKTALLAIFFGSCLGTIIAGAAMIAGRLNREHRIPFGPFLAAGLWLAVLKGNAIVTTYIGLFR